MSRLTLQTAQEMLNLWIEAEKKITVGQSYSIDTGGSSRSLTRANLKEVRESIEYWEARCAELSGEGKRAVFRKVTPVDDREQFFGRIY